MSTATESAPSTPVLEVEVVETPTQLVAAVKESGLEGSTATNLLDAFKPAFATANKLISDARAVSVTDATMVSEIKKARALRLQLKEVRVTADKLREKMKANALREGNAVQGVFNVLKFLVEPIEEKLEEAEKFAERAEAARKAKLKTDREALLALFGVDTSVYQLGEMTDSAFATLLEGTRLAVEAQAAALAKARLEQEEAALAAAAEAARIVAENARLKKEADERESAAKIEREKAAAAAEIARKEKEAAEAAAAKAKADAEAAIAKAKADAEAAAEKARVEAAEAARKIQEAADLKAKQEREGAAAEAARIKAEADAVAAKLKAEADAKLAAERKKAEEAAAAERARVAEEKRIADEKARVEREELERKAAADRAAREKIEAEARAAREAEEARVAAQLAAEKAAAAAPDKEKLVALAETLRAIVLPELTSAGGPAIIQEIESQRQKFAAWVLKKSEAL